MRAIAALLALALPASAQLIAPGVQLGPETRIADFTFGGIQTDPPVIVPNGSGYLAYVNVGNDLVAIPVHPDGGADLLARTTVGPAGLVAVSSGHPLVFSVANGALVAKRLGGTAVTVANSAASVRGAACDDRGCLVAYFTTATPAFVIATDTEGNPVSDATQLPDFAVAAQNVTDIAADANGFTILRGGPLLTPPRLVRVDRAANIVYDVSILGPKLTIRIVPAGDHAEIVAPVQSNGQWSIAAMTVSPADGTLSTPRPLVKIASSSVVFTFEPSSTGGVLAVPSGQHVALLTTDSSLMSATPAGGVDLPANMTLWRTVANGSVAIGLLGVSTYFTMGTASVATPSLLSYGPMQQVPRGIASIGSDALVAWSEFDRVSARETLRAAFVSSSGAVRDVIEVGRSSSTTLLPLTTVGTDALALWYDEDVSRSRGAIIHSDASITPVTFGTPLVAAAVVAMSNQWAVFALDASNRIAVLQVSPAGTATPVTTIQTLLPVVFGAGSDGSQVLLLVPSETILLNSGLTIEQRRASANGHSGTLVFSDDAYLFADGQDLSHMDKTGTITSIVPFATPIASVVPAANGWMVFTSENMTAVAGTDPITAGIAVSLPGIDTGPLVTAAGTMTLLYARGAAVYLRAVELLAPPRRRAAVSR